MDDDFSSELNGLAQNYLDLAGLYTSMNIDNKNREDMRYYYNDQKNWNSPANQMRLRLAAGLNPYGEFTANSVGAPSQLNSTVPESLQSLSSNMSVRQQQRMERIAQRISYKQLLLEERKVDNDTKRAEATARLVSSQATYQNMVNTLKEMLMGNELEMSDAELSNIIIQNGLLAKTFNAFDKRNEEEVNKLIAEVNSINSGASLNNAQVKRINELLPHEVTKLKADATMADFDATVAQLVDSILPDDNAANKPVKAIFRLILKKFLTM